MSTRDPQLIFFDPRTGDEVLLPPPHVPAETTVNAPSSREQNGIELFASLMVTGFGTGTVCGVLLYLSTAGYDFAAVRGLLIFLWTR